MSTNIPPHNAAEGSDAALVLIDNPRAELAQLLEHVKGPDFPTGGIVVDSAEAIAQAYETGRGGFRVRARFSTGKDADGVWESSGVERSEEHTSEIQSLMRISYAVFCLKKKKIK